MGGANIVDLPVELLDTILHLVRGGSRNDLLACLRTCRQWQALGTPLLYKHIYLKIADAFVFATRIKSLSVHGDAERHLHHIRSLRIMVPGDGRDYCGMTWLGKATEVLGLGIEALASVLPLLTALRTFSVIVYSGLRMNGVEDYLGTMTSRRAPGPNVSVFSKLVRALPPSVRDLHIDASELSRTEPQHTCDLCPAITALLPKLENLSLHLRSYCAGLLEIPEYLRNEPNLRQLDRLPRFPLQTAIIRAHGFRLKQCCSFPPGLGWTSFDLDLFTIQMSILIRDGAFPSLRQFLVFSKRRPPHIRQHIDCKWTIYARELVSDKTAVFPRLFLEQHKTAHQQPGNSFTYAPRTMIRMPSNCSFIDMERWGQEYVGGCGAIRRMVEGLTGWATFRNGGPHIPGARAAEVKLALEQGYVPKHRDPELVSVFRQKNELTCQLWKDEDTTGCKLLEPIIWDGVFDSKLLIRRDPLE